MNLTGVFPQLHFNSSHTAVLLRIVQCFLYHPKQGKPDFKWQSAGYLIFEVDLHPLPLTEFLAPTFDACNNAQIFQF